MIRLSMAFFWITAFLGASPSVIPIGINLHNPGNLMSENIHIWKGAVGIDRWGHLRFRTDMDGLRAMGKILRAYHRRYGINTVSGIANRWVARPRNRQQRKELKDYILALSQCLGVTSNESLPMDDPREIMNLTACIVYTENGVQPYPAKLFEQSLSN